MTMFTNTTGVRRKGVKAGSTQGPMRTVTTVITGEPVKRKPKAYKSIGATAGNAVSYAAERKKPVGATAGGAINYKDVQDLDKKFNRGGKVCK